MALEIGPSSIRSVPVWYTYTNVPRPHHDDKKCDLVNSSNTSVSLVKIAIKVEVK